MATKWRFCYIEMEKDIKIIFKKRKSKMGKVRVTLSTFIDVNSLAEV